MSHTIRERGQKIFQAGKEKSLQGIAVIASATGIPRSSVQRHQQAIERRHQYPESEWWETEAGSTWLKLLVVGSLFFFGIKHGIGVGEVSQFLKALRLGLHVGCSPSALDQLKQQMKDTIAAYETAQVEHCQPQNGQGICVGADEVFFGLPVLVLAELASGYVLTEVQCEDRCYETWREQIQQWWTQTGWQCHFMVSDRAKALIKLATDGLGCVSVADLFHALRSLGQPIGSALGRQQAQLTKQMHALKTREEVAHDDANRLKLSQSLRQLSTQQVALSQDQQQYHAAIIAISLGLHPFTLDSQQPQTGSDIATALEPPLTQLRHLAHTYGKQKALLGIETFQQHLPELIGGLHAWWQ